VPPVVADNRLFLRLPALSLCVLLALPGCDSNAIDPADAGMEDIEETTESFANALLDMSIAARRRDSAAVAEFIAPRIESNGWPEHAGDPEIIRWTSRRHYKLEAAVAEQSREQFVTDLGAFLDLYAAIEDVRFKIAKSTTSSTAAGKDLVDADIKFWIVGRDRDGHRSWTRGKGTAKGRLEDERWQLDRLVLKSLETMLANRDVFDEIAEPAGLAATAPRLTARRGEPFAAYGAAADDVDGDGFLDIFVTGAQANRLYLGSAAGTFKEVAAEAMLRDLPHTATAPLFLDFDGDGDRDLFLAAIGEQYMFENRRVPDGRLEFLDVSLDAGVAHSAIGFSAVGGDLNGDGATDIYVASYNRYGNVLPDHWDGATNGTPNLLFLSNGDGTYREAAAEMGVDDRRWSYAAGFADVDSDGHLDLYVANDFGGENALFMRRGARFVDEATQRGVADGGYGMGVSFADYDNDGDLDLHVTRMSSTAGRLILARLGGGKLPERDRLESMAIGNALYRGNGDGSFVDVSAEAGPFGAGWAWGGGFIDFDNDGSEDLYTPNGFISGPSLKDT
jgi:hypothetical protein